METPRPSPPIASVAPVAPVRASCRARRIVPVGVVVALVGALAAGGSARADVLVTKAGLRVEGTVERQDDGSWLVRTPQGSHAFAAAAVADVRHGVLPRADLEARLAVGNHDVPALSRFLLEAEAEGLDDIALSLAERIVALKSDHLVARRMLRHECVDGTWLPEDEARRRRGLVLFAGAWHSPEDVERLARAETAAPAPDAPPGTEARGVAELIALTVEAEAPLRNAATLRLAQVEGETALQGGTIALGDGRPIVRSAAATFLGEWGDESALRPLLATAVRDPDAGVREAALEAARSFGHPETAIPLVKALASKNVAIAGHAAEALGRLGDQRATSFLVKKLISSGSSPRAFVSFLNQISYVGDYDVEIAQLSNIANPVVSTLNEGVTLDAHVLGASIERTWLEPIILGAIGRLAGRSFQDAGEVRAWYVANEAVLPTFPDTPGKRAPARARKGKVIGALPAH